MPGIQAILWRSGWALLVTLALTPILRDIFRVYQIVDRPGLRKVHEYPIPRLGGIALAAAFALGLIGLHAGGLAGRILPAAALMVLTGVVDDFFNLPAVVKLFGQVAAACVAYWAGLRVPEPAAISFPVTVFWLVLASNAFNLVDGLDGLCAGLGCASAGAMFLLALVRDDVPLEAGSLILAGALLGFLFHNFSRATMFLGDSGALLIGFLLGCYGVMWTEQTGASLSMLAPLLVIGVPVTEVCLSVLRRRVAGRPIFSADQGHMHHRLMERGFSSREAVLMLYAWGAGGGVFAFLLVFPSLRAWRAWIIALFLVFILAGVRELRYSEFKWRRTG
ncbi:MAG TPA: MraY family glycosyltransferase [Bryobacteraceae bacterium]|nr:MraY family glycosyltransferase [Bryobacteraceae bacterium]